MTNTLLGIGGGKVRMNVGRLGECNGMLIEIDMHHFVHGSTGTLGITVAVVPWALLLLLLAVVVRDESLFIKPRKLTLSTKILLDADRIRTMQAENEIFMVRFARMY